MTAPRSLARSARTWHIVAALLLPAILLLQLSCDCASARGASAPQARASAHGCCPDAGHRPAPSRPDHDPACGHCQPTLAPGGGIEAPAVHLAAGPGLLALAPHGIALRASTSLRSISDRAAAGASRLRTCVLLL